MFCYGINVIFLKICHTMNYFHEKIHTIYFTVYKHTLNLSILYLATEFVMTFKNYFCYLTGLRIYPPLCVFILQTWFLNIVCFIASKTNISMPFGTFLTEFVNDNKS